VDRLRSRPGCWSDRSGGGFGHRAGLWQFTTGFWILRWAVYAAILAAVISAVASLLAFLKSEREAFVRGLAGLATGALVVAPMLWQIHAARSVPAIHDITTDTEDPPSFVDILPLRRSANPVDREDPNVTALQRKAYPDIEPLVVRVPPSRAFEASLASARAMGLDPVAVNPGEGRIEATATTFWFGFKDDVVIRVRPDKQGARVDVRSASRVGVSDIGTNARRIRGFLASLRKRL
jgi:uncharacterized protein (DUF1499 family)